MNTNARTWSTLTAFKRDIIVACLRRGGRPDADDEDLPYGLGIKRELEIIRDAEVNHGRLYPNFDDLADAGLLSIDERDGRTNTYRVTEAGVDALFEYVTEYAGLPVGRDGIADLPGVAYDDQTSQEREEGDEVDTTHDTGEA